MLAARWAFGALALVLASSGWASASDVQGGVETSGARANVSVTVSDPALPLPQGAGPTGSLLHRDGAHGPNGTGSRGLAPHEGNDTRRGEPAGARGGLGEAMGALRLVVQELRETFLGEFRAWKEEARASWKADADQIRADLRNETAHLREAWKAEVAAWQASCAHEAAAGSSGGNDTAPADRSNRSACRQQRDDINRATNAALRQVRQDAERAKQKLNADWAQRIEDKMETLLASLQDAIAEAAQSVQGDDGPFRGLEDRLLQGMDRVSGNVQGRLGDRPAAGPPSRDREPQGNESGRCDASGRCTPPPACVGRMGTPGCTPPSFCKDNGDGSFTCTPPRPAAAEILDGSRQPMPAQPPPPQPAAGSAETSSNASAGAAGTEDGSRVEGNATASGSAGSTGS